MEVGGTPLGRGVAVALANIEAMAARSLRRAREGAYLRAQLTGDGFRHASRRAFHRPPRMNLVQWTEEYRHHTEFSKAKGSKVSISDLEVTRGPFLWVTEPGVREVGIMACTQSGKTFLMESVAGWVMHTDPGPIAYIGPTQPNAEQFIDEKLMKMVAATPVLQPLINTSRTSGNRADYKRFPGGRIRGVGTESRVGFSMVADKWLLMDEIDDHRDAGGAGNTYQLALGRTPEFAHSYKLFAVSSPRVKSRGNLPTIYGIFKSGDERLPFVQCQSCGHDHFMEWHREGAEKPSLYMPKRDDDARGTFEPGSARYECPKCHHLHTDNERIRMLRKGAIHWRATKAFKCCGTWQDPRVLWESSDQTRADYDRIWQPFGEPLGVPVTGFGERGVCRAKCQTCGKMPVSNRIATGHYGRFYRPQFSLAEMAEQYVAVIRDPSKRPPFWNEVLGLPFEARKSEAMSVDVLDGRAEIWPSWVNLDTGETEWYVPWGVAVTTIGIDVQKGAADGSGARFAMNRIGWGEGEEVYVLDYREEPARTRDVSEWERVLLPYIERQMQRSDGRAFVAMSICIDSGNNPDQASEFVARHRARLFARGIHLWAVKGRPENGKQRWSTWAGEAQQAKAFEKFNNPHVKLYGVGTREAKDTVAGFLRTEAGPGTVHYPKGTKRHWLEGVLAEDQVERQGRLVWEHIRQSVANEPLDCFVYNLAALRALQSEYPAWRLDEWAKRIGAIKPTAISEPTADDGRNDAEPSPMRAAAESAVRLHGALTAIADASVPAREGAGAPQSVATPAAAPTPPADEPWMVDTGWQPPAMPWD